MSLNKFPSESLNNVSFKSIVDFFALKLIRDDERFVIFEHNKKYLIIYNDEDQKIRCIQAGADIEYTPMELFYLLSDKLLMNFAAETKEEFVFSNSISGERALSLFYELLPISEMDIEFDSNPAKILEKEPFSKIIFASKRKGYLNAALFWKEKVSNIIGFNERTFYHKTHNKGNVFFTSNDFKNIIVTVNPYNLFCFFEEEEEIPNFLLTNYFDRILTSHIQEFENVNLLVNSHKEILYMIPLFEIVLNIKITIGDEEKTYWQLENLQYLESVQIMNDLNKKLREQIDVQDEELFKEHKFLQTKLGKDSKIKEYIVPSNIEALQIMVDFLFAKFNIEKIKLIQNG